jgi:hypothetical protein
MECSDTQLLEKIGFCFRQTAPKNTFTLLKLFRMGWGYSDPRGLFGSVAIWIKVAYLIFCTSLYIRTCFAPTSFRYLVSQLVT